MDFAPRLPTAAIKRVRGWERGVLAMLGGLLRLWGASLRFETTPVSAGQLHDRAAPLAMVLWHNRLFLSAEIFRRYRQGRPVYALVSASKDGAWLEAFFGIAGLRTVRGSSSKLGREAALLLVGVLRRGGDIGITPDGPRGPCYEFKAGGLVVARRAKSPILLLGGVFDSAWQLNSWDRFFIPKPFSRVRVTGRLLLPSLLSDRENGADVISAHLTAINSDALPGANFVVI